jgi:hypothetical protein
MSFYSGIFYAKTFGLRSVPGRPGNLSIPIRFYYRIRELNFYFPGLPGFVFRGQRRDTPQKMTVLRKFYVIFVP